MKILIAAVVAITIMLLLVSYSFYTGKAQLPAPERQTINSKITTQSQLMQEAKEIGMDADQSAKKCYDLFEEVLITTNSYDDDMKKKIAQARVDLENGEKSSREVAQAMEEVNRLALSHFGKGEK